MMSMHDEEFYGGNVPYDPDMTVQEAISAGLVVPMDAPDLRRKPDQDRCAYEGPVEQVFTPCIREHGHTGPHVFVLRWRTSWADVQKERERVAATLREANAAMAKIAPPAQELVKSFKEMGAKIQAMGEHPKPDMKEEFAREAKRLARLDSMSYSPVDGNRKNARFRDKNVGKVRGR